MADDSPLNLAIFARNYDQVPPVGFQDAFAFTDNATSQKGFTQELRLQSADDGPLNWVVGAFYSRSITRDEFGSVNLKLLPLINYGRESRGLPPLTSVSEMFGVEPYLGKYVSFKIRDTSTCKNPCSGSSIMKSYPG